MVSASGVEEWRQGCPRVWEVLSWAVLEVLAGSGNEGAPALPDLLTGSLGCSPLTRLLPQIQSSGLEELGGFQTRWSHVWGTDVPLTPVGSPCPERSAPSACPQRALRWLWPQSSPPLQSICSPLRSSLPSPLLSTWLWASSVLFLSALVPELGTHSVRVRMAWRLGAERAGLPREDPAVGSLGRPPLLPSVWFPFAGPGEGTGSCLLSGQTTGLIPT